MSTEWTQEENRKVMAEVARRSATDPEFRALCFADPSAAIAQVAGRPVPEGVNIRFIDNQGADLTVVLPDPVKAEGELSDEELEEVAGGSRCAGTCLLSCAVTSTVTYGDGSDGVLCY
ncbi:MAG: hypothetical protein AAGD38_05780 [Acidobacteriota bacterium]